MMYESKLAVALKSAGKVLREFKDSVYVPFGSEYSIFVKNMNNVRALVSVTIDGEDVGDGTRFIVEADDSIDIERFITNGNLNRGNRLKFIERNEAVEDHRGIGVEDGLVRVEFQFEKVYVPTVYPQWSYTNTGQQWYGGSGGPLRSRGSLTGGAGDQVTYTSNSTADIVGSAKASVNVSNVTLDNDAGVTVPGSISDQAFHEGGWFPTETESHVIVLKMLGQTKDNTPVRKAVTVRTKPKCVTCGSTNKATAKFCTECGTSLKIV